MRPLDLTFSPLIAALVVGAACSGAPTRAPATVDLPARPGAGPDASTSAPKDAPLLWARALPAGLALDGALDEWGIEPGVDQVVVGIAPDRLVIAATWTEAVRPIVSLALAQEAPVLPSIGWSQRGGSTHELTPERCAFEQIPLIEAGWQDGNRHPPEVERACLDVLARHARESEAYRERFVRRLRFEGDTASLLDAKGGAHPIAGALAKVRGQSAEIALPLTALPDLDQAPLAFLLGGAAFGELPASLRAGPRRASPWSDEAATLPAGWAPIPLDVPVAFGAQPDLLAATFAEATSSPGGEVASQLSYAPAQPDTIRSVSVPDVAVPQNPTTPNVPGAIGGPTAPDRPALSVSEEPLSTPLETFGAVRVVETLGNVATLVEGRLVSRVGFGRPDGTRRRAGALHLFRYDAGGFSWSVGYQPPVWRVLAVLPDGKVAEEVAEEGVDWPGMHDAWDDDPTVFHDPDWASFGMRGQRKGGPKTVTWRWDAASSRYLVSVRPPQSYP